MSQSEAPGTEALRWNSQVAWRSFVSYDALRAGWRYWNEERQAAHRGLEQAAQALEAIRSKQQ